MSKKYRQISTKHINKANSKYVRIRCMRRPKNNQSHPLGSRMVSSSEVGAACILQSRRSRSKSCRCKNLPLTLRHCGRRIQSLLHFSVDNCQETPRQVALLTCHRLSTALRRLPVTECFSGASFTLHLLSTSPDARRGTRRGG